MLVLQLQQLGAHLLVPAHVCGGARVMGPATRPLHHKDVAPGSPRGVSSIKDLLFRSAPCATSSSTRRTCGPERQGC